MPFNCKRKATNENAEYCLKSGVRRVSRRMALLDPPDTADNVENTVRELGGGHGVLDRLAQHTSLYSPDLSTPLFYSPPGLRAFRRAEPRTASSAS